jgi:helix-turn-helix protein
MEESMNWQLLARANTHPLRISILEVLGMDGGRILSPSDLSYELRTPLSNVNYHVTELRRTGLVELTGERPVRGATEHFYREAKISSNGHGNGNGRSSNGRVAKRKRAAAV